MSEPLDVGDAGEFPEGRHRFVQAGSREIAVIRWRGRLFALRTVCPHQAAPVCGAVLPGVSSDGLHSIRSKPGAPVVQCTWHRWEFDLETGRALCDPKTKIKTFKAYEQGGRVLVEI